MVMTLRGILHVRIDSTLEYLAETWIQWLLIGASREMDVEKRRDMSKVEDALISQVDGLGQQLIFRDHLSGNSVPRRPEFSPLIKRGDRLCSILLWLGGKECQGL